MNADSRSRDDNRALAEPAERRDSTWPERVARAKEAREAAQEVRKGKPPGFPSRVSLRR